MIRPLILALGLVFSLSIMEGNDAHMKQERCIVTIRSVCTDTTTIRILDGMRVSDLVEPGHRWSGILFPGDSMRTEVMCETGYITVLIDSIFDVTYRTRPDSRTTYISFTLRDTMRMKMPINVTNDDTRITAYYVQSVQRLRQLAASNGSAGQRIASIDSAMPDIVRGMADAAGIVPTRAFTWAPYRDIHAIRLFDIIQMLRKDTTEVDTNLVRRYLDSSYRLLRTAYDTDERVSNSAALQLLCQASLLAKAALLGDPNVDSAITTLCRTLRSFRDDLIALSCPTADRITSLNLDYRLASTTSDFTYEDLVRNDDFRDVWHRSSDTALLQAVIDRHFQLGTGRRFQGVRIVDQHGTESVIATRDSTTVIYFWGSWCGPCLHTIGRMDIDSLSSVLRRYGAKLLFVAVERNDRSDEWRAIGRRYGFDDRSVRASFPIGSASARAIGILGLPMMRAVDAGGTIVSTNYVPLDDVELFTRYLQHITHQ